MFEDSKQIMAFQNKEYVSPEDKEIVWNVVNKTQKILNEPLLSEIKKNTKNIDRIIQNPIQIKKIAKQVEKNLEENKLVSAKTTSSYQQDFRKIAMDLTMINSIDEWIDRSISISINDTIIRDTKLRMKTCRVRMANPN